jgi:hypothetical protein
MKNIIIIFTLAIFAASAIQAQQSRIASPKREFSRMPKDDSGHLNSILDEVPKEIPAALQAKIRNEISETWDAYWDSNRKAHPALMNADIREMVFPNVWSFFLAWEALKFDFYWETTDEKG